MDDTSISKIKLDDNIDEFSTERNVAYKSRKVFTSRKINLYRCWVWCHFDKNWGAEGSWNAITVNYMVTINSVLIFIPYTKMGSSANPDMTLEWEVCVYFFWIKYTCRIGAVLYVPHLERTFLWSFNPGNAQQK